MGLFRWILGLLARLWVLFFLGSLAWAWRLRHGPDGTPVPIPASDAAEIELVGVFGGHEFTSTATAFRGGRITAAYGGGLLDLRGAMLDPAGARLAIRAVFGGYQVVVPPEWRVDLDVVGIFGGVTDGRDPSTLATDGPVLEVEGYAIFGGASFVTERRDAAAGFEAARGILASR